MASQWTFDSAHSVANNTATNVVTAAITPAVGELVVVAAQNSCTTSFSTAAISDNSSGGGAWHAVGGESGSTTHFTQGVWYKIANAADAAGITVTVTFTGGSGTLASRIQADLFSLPAGYTPVLDTFATNFQTATTTLLITTATGQQNWTDCLAYGVLSVSVSNGGGACQFISIPNGTTTMTTALVTGDTLLDVLYHTGITDQNQTNDNFQFSWTTTRTNPIGTGVLFYYTPPPPTVTGVSPNTGPAAGGTSVTITGTNFTDGGGAWAASAVNFGGVAATSVVVVNATTITCVSPAGSGVVDVTVVTPGGTSATSGSDKFTYGSAPTVSSVSPNIGPSAGGQSVTIDGQFFTGTTSVHFGANAATSVVVISDFTITCNSPAGVNRTTVDVTVTNASGTSATNSNDLYEYLDVPVVTSINPTTGPTGGGTPVTITGSNFTGATEADFALNAATGFNVVNDTTITCFAPPGSVSTVDVTVVNAAGTSLTSAGDQFTYFPGPPVVQAQPSGGSGGAGEGKVDDRRAMWDTDEERDVESLFRLGAL